MRIGEIPPIPRTTGVDSWGSLIESHALMICEVASYASELPKGHLEIMFNRIAEALILQWAMSNPEEPPTAMMKFGALIQACSDESQLLKTGSGTATIETGACRILSICRSVDPDASKLPAGYPCALHEIIAKKLSELTGAKITVNTSSTGCIVGMSLE